MSFLELYIWVVRGRYLEEDSVMGLKGFRMVSMFERLTRWERLRKETEAKRFGVNAKTIQRDIDCSKEESFWFAHTLNNDRVADLLFVLPV